MANCIAFPVGFRPALVGNRYLPSLPYPDLVLSESIVTISVGAFFPPI